LHIVRHPVDILFDIQLDNWNSDFHSDQSGDSCTVPAVYDSCDYSCPGRMCLPLLRLQRVPTYMSCGITLHDEKLEMQLARLFGLGYRRRTLDQLYDRMQSQCGYGADAWPSTDSGSSSMRKLELIANC
jgi:hypothetical protein